MSHDICHRNSLHRYGGWGYDHIARTVVPQLRDHLGDDLASQLTASTTLRRLHWTG